MIITGSPVLICREVLDALREAWFEIAVGGGFNQ
ncbi:hypothetical protein A2U01_0112475, partial [Trifolium medium]|nr:hypothetical protein [Trifolium medium]